MVRAISAIDLAVMTAASAVLGAIVAGLVSFPLLFLVFRASDWLGVKLLCGNELVMMGPFLAGIGGFLFGAPCGAIACLSRTATGVLRGILAIAVAMIVAAFGASVGLWWIGQNFIDLAPYINDARDLELILLGGVTGKDIAGYHDWEYLLGKLGLLKWDHALAKFAHYFGSGLMLLALAWGAYMLFLQYRVLKNE